MSKIWFDIDNTPHVNFFKPIINHLKADNQIIYTLKEFAEVEKLFIKEIGSPYKMVGKHKGGSKIMKVLGVAERTIQLMMRMEKFDLKISIGGDSSNLCAKARFKKSITFDDNETAPNWRYAPFTDMAFWPKAIPYEIIKKQGFGKAKTYQYDGYKEDIYIADYVPDESFLDTLPFEEYVVVRPENILANYVDSKKTIVPDLIKKLLQKGYNVLYLPRYKHDHDYVEKSNKIFIPDAPLRGLDVCYHAQAVLTGAGTIARESVCLGTPAVSFYAGSKLLMVDKSLIKEKRMIHSRSVDEIVDHVSTVRKSNSNQIKSKAVKEEVLFQIDNKLNKWF